jgi:hypothetical protein
MGGFGSGVWPRIGRKAKTGERLAFDIRYLPDNKAAIEFNGQQHYRPLKWFGGRPAFDKQRDRDAMKRVWCRIYGVRLLVLKDIDSVEKRVTSFVREVACGVS